jgi:hypothetical protein
MAIRNRIRSIAGALIPAIDAAVTAALALKADKDDLGIPEAATITPITGDEIAPALSGGVLGKITYSAIKTWVLSGLQIAWGSVTGKPTTLVGYGITDAEPAKGADDNYVTDAEKTNIGNLGTAAYTASTAYASALGADDNYVTDAQKAALHAAATVTGNGIALTGQQISLSIGTGSTQVAAGNHTHSGVYAASSHTHVSADVTDASTGGNGATDSGKLVKFGGEGGGITFAGTNTFGISGASTNGNGVRASSSNGNALSAVASGNGANYHATFGNSGDDRSFVARLLGALGWWRGAYTLMVSAVDTLTADRVQRFPDKDGTIALTSDITGTNSGTNTGDQTTIAGITGTVAQFNTALTDGDFATLAGTDALTNKTLTNPVINSYVEGVVAIGNSSTSQTIALTAGTVQTCTLTGNCTFTMPTATAGKSFVLYLNTGAGSLTGTFTGVKWAGGTAPTITATASRMDILSFVADGTNWYGSAIQNYTP